MTKSIQTCDELEKTKILLADVILSMKKANEYDQLGSGLFKPNYPFRGEFRGYLPVTYGEALEGIIADVREYQEELARAEVGGE